MAVLPLLFSVAGFMKKLGSGLAAAIPSGSYDNLQISPTDATCNISFNSAGTCSVSAGTTPSSPANWLTGTGTGANYWIRWTNTSGTLSTGTAGSWLQLNANQTFGVSFTLNSAGSKVCTGTVEIATDSGGANVIASGSITLNAQVDL